MKAGLYAQMHELEDRHWWFTGRRRIVAEMIRRLGLPPDARLLDAGCGTGGNLALLAGFGEPIGAEYDAEAARLARARGVCEVVRAGLPHAMPFAPGRFDLVTLLDVLEHIEDDAASLRTLASLLAPGGHLLLTVPAFPFLWGPHDEAHHHHRRYRAAGLRAVIEGAGLKLQWQSYYNSSLFPAVAAVRLLHRLLPAGPVGDELALPPAPVNALLEALFAAERHLLGRVRLPAGVSLIAVARRP